MSDPIGNAGGLAVEPETTWGTTVDSSWDWLYGVRSTLGYRRTTIMPNWLTMASPANRPYNLGWVDGEITTMFTDEDDIIGTLLAAGAIKSTLNYVFGTGATPENDVGLSVMANYGGVDATFTNGQEWIFSGCRPTAYRFSIVPDDGISLTVPMIGKGVVKTASGSVVAPVPASETYIAMPTDAMTITYGGSTAFKIKRADISVDLPKSGNERRSLGETVIRKPVALNREVVNLSVTMDLSDETNADSIDMLADFVAGTELGAFVIGDFLGSGWKPTGDFPALDSGLMELTLSGQCSTLTVQCEDTIT